MRNSLNIWKIPSLEVGEFRGLSIRSKVEKAEVSKYEGLRIESCRSFEHSEVSTFVHLKIYKLAVAKLANLETAEI